MAEYKVEVTLRHTFVHDEELTVNVEAEDDIEAEYLARIEAQNEGDYDIHEADYDETYVLGTTIIDPTPESIPERCEKTKDLFAEKDLTNI